MSKKIRHKNSGRKSRASAAPISKAQPGAKKRHTSGGFFPAPCYTERELKKNIMRIEKDQFDMNTTIMQGTTPVFSFTLPFESAQVESFFLTFRQGKETVIEKKLTDCETKDYELSVTLSQEDTFLLQSQTPVLMQVRMTDKNGAAFASPVFTLRAERALKGGTIV